MQNFDKALFSKDFLMANQSNPHRIVALLGS